jgi:hypothetical protein
MKRIASIFTFIFLLTGIARATSVPEGVWEGLIEDPKRPIVINVDFTARKVSLSGAAPTTLRLNSADGGPSVDFEVVLGQQVLKFSGSKTATRIVGRMTTNGREISFWLELLPSLPRPAGRIEAWQQDIDVVTSRFLRYDRSFSDAKRAASRGRLLALRSRINRLSDQAIMVEIARAVALSGNAHTRLYLMRNRTEVRRVPLRVWWFRNELHVVRAASPYAELNGCRVARIGSRPVDFAFRTMRNIKAGNLSWQRYMSSYFLTSPDLLFGAQLLPDPEHLPLTVACAGRMRRITLKPLPLKRSTAPVEAWWDLAPSYQAPSAEFKTALAAEQAPLYLQHPDRNYWVEYLEPSAMVYVQYNRAQEMSSEPMDEFIRRISKLLDENKVRGFIVDVRFNTGGDAGVGTPLVETLAPRLKKVPVVVLTGRATFSAGITHAAQWKQIANASIVGEPVGDGLDLWSEGGNLLLPNSGLTVHYANGFHAYSQKDYPQFKPYFADLNVATLAPDKLVMTGWEDYAAGRDPVLATAVYWIQNHK